MVDGPMIFHNQGPFTCGGGSHQLLRGSSMGYARAVSGSYCGAFVEASNPSWRGCQLGAPFS
jgi:hypothetical protein